MPLVSHTGLGVIDRQANFILGACDASSFLFPIGQQRQRGELVNSGLRLKPFNITIVGTECVIRIRYHNEFIQFTNLR